MNTSTVNGKRYWTSTDGKYCIWYNNFEKNNKWKVAKLNYLGSTQSLLSSEPDYQCPNNILWKYTTSDRGWVHAGTNIKILCNMGMCTMFSLLLFTVA